MECPKCDSQLEKDYVVVGHRWNFRHPTEWEMRADYYKCTECKEEYDPHEVEDYPMKKSKEGDMNNYTLYLLYSYCIAMGGGIFDWSGPN